MTKLKASIIAAHRKIVHFVHKCRQFLFRYCLTTRNIIWNTVTKDVHFLNLPDVDIIIIDSEYVEVTMALFGGVARYSYIRVLTEDFFLKSLIIRDDFKRNSSGRT